MSAGAPCSSAAPDRLMASCGLVAVHGHPQAARLAAQALQAMQHRGAMGAGIARWDGSALRAHRLATLAGPQVASPDGLEQVGELAIGRTHAGLGLEAEQPLLRHSRAGWVAVVHDGRLTNATPLRQGLEARGALFQSAADAEVVLHLLAASAQETLVNRLVEALYQLEGAYALALLAEGRLVAVRDPWGLRPLVLGCLGEAWVLASESCALSRIGARVIREIEPGEMIIIDGQGLQSLQPLPRKPRRACVFEATSIAEADSVIAGRPVYGWRQELGRRLAEEHPASADAVIAPPDSRLPVALGFADQSRIPFQLGLLRALGGGGGLPDAPVREVLAGRRLVVVLDQLARGEEARALCRLLRQHGAAELHLRVAAPPLTGSCPYGLQTAESPSLLAARLNLAQIRGWLEADSLGFLSLEGLRAVQGEDRGRTCEACISGDFPVPAGAPEPVQQLPLFVRGA